MTERSLLTAIGDAWGSFAALLAEAGDGELRHPTRCDGWQVRDLLDHVLWGTSMEAEALERAARGDTTSATGRREAALDAAHGRGLLARRLAALTTAGEAALATADTAADPTEVIVPLQLAAVPLPVALRILLLEAGVHADDLRHALTGRSHLEPAVVDAVLAVLPPYLAAAATAADHVPPGPVEVRLQGRTVDLTYRYDGDGWSLLDEPRAPSVTATGEDESLALLLLGRSTPDGDRFEVTGAGELLGELKRWLPGP